MMWDRGCEQDGEGTLVSGTGLSWGIKRGALCVSHPWPKAWGRHESVGAGQCLWGCPWLLASKAECVAQSVWVGCARARCPQRGADGCGAGAEPQGV